MATKDARGTKRTCQSSECGARFYDLNRDPIVCPICGTIYEIAHAAPGTVVDVKEKPAKKAAQRESVREDAVDEMEDADDIEDIEDIEADDDAADADSDAFLEDEEEDGDMADIISPAKDGDEDV